MAADVALVELFVAVLIAGVSAVNAVLPLSAWSRTREVRFVWVALANLSLVGFGSVDAWSELPGTSGAPAPVPFPTLLLVLVTALLLLVATVWPRRT